jgi:hypothetical protein
MDDGVWGYPYETKPNELVLTLRLENGELLRKRVLAPGDPVNLEWARIGGPQRS